MIFPTYKRVIFATYMWNAQNGRFIGHTGGKETILCADVEQRLERNFISWVIALSGEATIPQSGEKS